MTLQGINGESYNIGRELGRGGEGQVFDVLNHTGLVFKRYNEKLQPLQLSKLQQMVAMRSPAIEVYAAWPRDIVLDEHGVPCGFVMKKLTGFVPLHMIFSPMDRKKMFPDKGYNFLAHVARNLATAFHKLHETGLVVGDVNEGNILISGTGLVSFIDCDSFQVKGGDSYFYCEVGVPRYTPPELLKLGSFDNVVRTVNTDSFSLAILIFQLLFLGRHPFAGKNNVKADFDEETAIRQHEFAYSLDRVRKKLTPPKDSFSITNLPDDIVAFFHKAFEQDERPVPADWVQALDGLLADMVTCAASRIHSYPSKLIECPWCAFKETRGIMYFLDDSYLKSNALAGDIDQFVNGFKIEHLELKKWQGSQLHPQLAANPIEKTFRKYRRDWIYLYVLYSVCFICIWYIANLNTWLAPLYILGFLAINKFAVPIKRTKAEIVRQRTELGLLQTKLLQLITEHDNPPDLIRYANAVQQLEKMVQDFKQLPDRFKQLKEAMEERLYNEQLGYYLGGFKIADYEIQSIGNVRKEALLNNGIRSASDINLLANNTIKVPGIGPKNLQVLLSWQRQMASGFTYIPEATKIAGELLQISGQMDKMKLQLEHNIRREYQSLNYLKSNITNRAMVLERQINDLSIKTYQAELDLNAFKKFSWLKAA
jgi:DNA-binding helix-hairpin-helix protein with protein kinase domain